MTDEIFDTNNTENRIDLKLSTEIIYQQPNIGCFSSFKDIKHGFSWGKPLENMAYKWEKGDLEVVTKRVESFLQRLEMSPVRKSFTMEGCADSMTLDITDEVLDQSQPNSHGIFTGAHNVFTTLEGVPIIIKPGDCTASLIRGLTRDYKPIVGIIHSGRHELEICVPQFAIRHLIERYECLPSTIKIGIAPSLGKNNHIIRAKDRNKIFNNEDTWKPYLQEKTDGSASIDGQKFLIDQYLSMGVLPSNIEYYAVDTYKAAQEGDTFSHRYAITTNQPDKNGRFILAIQLG